MKFKDGDRFRVIENGVSGLIKGIFFNSMTQSDEYIVLWDTLKYEQTYPVDECDPIWEPEVVSPIPTVFMRGQNAIEFIPITIKMGDKIAVECNGHHTWVEVGFHFTKEVCKWCDIEKEKV